MEEETSETLSGTEQVVMFDTQAGKRALLSVLADYIAEHGEIDGESLPTVVNGLKGIMGSLDDLTTEQKTSLVAAINEVNGKFKDVTTSTKLKKLVTGNPIVVDDALGEVDSLGVSLLPVQDLHGYDKPWSAGAGVNKFNKATITDNAYINGIGEIATGQTEFFCSDYIPILPSTSYYSNADVNGRIYTYIFFDADKNYVDKNATSRGVFTSPANAYYVRVNAIKSNITADELMLNYPSTVTTYSPYTNICPITGRTQTDVVDSNGTDTTTTTVTLPHTVYGADVDVTGGASKDKMVLVDLGSLSWVKASYLIYGEGNVDLFVCNLGNVKQGVDNYVCSQYYCTGTDRNTMAGKDKCFAPLNTTTTYIGFRDSDYSDATAFKTAMNGVQLCYPLATPTDLQTTPTDVELFHGDNVLMGDGDMDMTYVRDIAMVINKIESQL